MPKRKHRRIADDLLPSLEPEKKVRRPRRKTSTNNTLPDGGTEMKSRYRQRCSECKKPIRVGDPIVWYGKTPERSAYALHRNCVGPQARPATPYVPPQDDDDHDENVWLRRMAQARDGCNDG